MDELHNAIRTLTHQFLNMRERELYRVVTINKPVKLGHVGTASDRHASQARANQLACERRPCAQNDPASARPADGANGDSEAIDEQSHHAPRLREIA